jgi:hypothetical protein
VRRPDSTERGLRTAVGRSDSDSDRLTSLGAPPGNTGTETTGATRSPIGEGAAREVMVSILNRALATPGEPDIDACRGDLRHEVSTLRRVPLDAAHRDRRRFSPHQLPDKHDVSRH